MNNQEWYLLPIQPGLPNLPHTTRIGTCTLSTYGVCNRFHIKPLVWH